MYKCTKCREVVGPRVAQKKLVVETREVVHHATWVDSEGYRHHKDTPGTQIVREVDVCPECYGNYK